jgi:hypothetical protein
MEKLLLILLLCFISCKESKYDIYIETNASTGIRSGKYLHDCIKVKKDTYMFILTHNGETDTTFVQIKSK